MNLEMTQDYLLHYGYIIIILSLFCGIVGIPAPEESFMVFVGMIAAKHQLNLFYSFTASFIGVFTGTIVAYTIGRKYGEAFIDHFGKYLFITREKWEKVSRKFHKYGKFTIIIAFFLPGLRQISPYVAGTSRYPIEPYIILSIIGNVLWSVIFIAGGYFLGNRIPFELLPWIPVLYMVVLLMFWFKGRLSKS